MESNLEFLDKSKLTAKELMGLVDLCLDSTFFKFRDKIFHQKLFTNIGQAYGVEVLNIVRKWEAKEIKRSLVREQLRFCTICRNRKVLPNFARIKSPVNSKRAREVLESCGRRLLKCALDHHHGTLHRLGLEIEEHRRLLGQSLDQGVLVEVIAKITSLSRSKAGAKRTVLDRKIG
ncbi:uncharacterized protein LOC143025770 [Oratosquilla oratoria]|uniref:uncharacterized protein LOC143025770 n=1 Tax=Oratosquilla oratoria TaxID=337810 RepID=UPI003F76B39D